MKITVDRAAVCMGDDMESHKTTVVLGDGASFKELIGLLRGGGFFASVSGNNVVWVLTADGGCVLAYYTKTERISMLRSDVKLSELCEMGGLFFKYYCSLSAWKSAIEGYYIEKDRLVSHVAWRGECEYCDTMLKGN